MKKLLAILLSVTMLLGCVAISAFADEADNSTGPVLAYVAPDEPTIISAAENGFWVDNTPNDPPEGLGVRDYNGIDIVTEFRPGDTITFKVDIEEEGVYDFAVKFIWQWATTISIAVDDGEAVTMNLNDFLEWKVATWSNPIQLDLEEGEHTITITHTMAGSGVHIEAIQFGPEGSVRDMTGCVFNAAYDIKETPVNGFSTYGYRVMINAAFDQFRIWMPGWGDETASCTVAIYAWEGNFDDTLEGEAIAEEYCDTIIRDPWVEVSFDEQEAGEYLIYVYDFVGAAGFYKVDADQILNSGYELKGYNYIDGNEPSQIHVPHLRVYTVEPYEGDDLFGECTPDVYPPAPETTAPETTVAPETTAPETTVADTTAEETTVADTTVADTTVADTTVAATTAEETTAALADTTAAAAGTKAPEATTAAKTSGGCGSVVASASAIALVAVASAAAVVLKKKED